MLLVGHVFCIAAKNTETVSPIILLFVIAETKSGNIKNGRNASISANPIPRRNDTQKNPLMIIIKTNTRTMIV